MMSNIRTMLDWFNPFAWLRHRAKIRKIQEFLNSDLLNPRQSNNLKDAISSAGLEALIYKLRELQHVNSPGMDSGLARSLIKQLITKVPVREHELFLNNIDNNNYIYALTWSKYQTAIDKINLYKKFAQDLQEFNKSKNNKFTEAFFAVLLIPCLPMVIFMNTFFASLTIICGLFVAVLNRISYLEAAAKHDKNTVELQNTIKDITNLNDPAVEINLDTLANTVDIITVAIAKIKQDVAAAMAALPAKLYVPIDSSPPDMLQNITWLHDKVKRKEDYRGRHPKTVKRNPQPMQYSAGPVHPAWKINKLD